MDNKTLLYVGAGIVALYLLMKRQPGVRPVLASKPIAKPAIAGPTSQPSLESQALQGLGSFAVANAPNIGNAISNLFSSGTDSTTGSLSSSDDFAELG